MYRMAAWLHCQRMRCILDCVGVYRHTLIVGVCMLACKVARAPVSESCLHDLHFQNGRTGQKAVASRKPVAMNSLQTAD
jgi:hypothetical protein